MPVQTFTTLNDPLTTNHFTTPAGINTSGTIVGFYEASGAAHGFLLSGGTYTTLDDPLGIHGTSAGGINDMGQIVGGYQDSASQTHGIPLERRCLHHPRRPCHRRTQHRGSWHQH
jgi:uncharacterized membrane protein